MMLQWVGRCLLVMALAGATLTVIGDGNRVSFYHQDLRWRPCSPEQVSSPGVECADVVVPLDYQEPDGRTITVAISRAKATDPARRRGILLSNPGGPGAGGLDSLSLLGDVLSPEVRARYDLIGIDPRGVGASDAPEPCGWPVPEMIRSAGLDAAGFDHEVALAADMAAACLDGDVAKLRRLTTRNTARDMDVVRSVLGEEKINFFGLSYGTYLGAVFTQMFPHRSDRIVLDSAIDPDRYWTGMVQDWGPADEAALDDWANWVALRDEHYHLGDTAPRVRRTVEDLTRRAANQPILVEGYPVDDHLLPFLLHTLLRSYRLNDVLAESVRELANAAEGRPTHSDESGLRDLLEALQAGENYALAVIACGDVGAPTDPEWYRHAVARTRAAQPVFGAMANNIQPCAFWPRPVEPPTVVRNSVPALILQATGDPRTPYPGGVRLHQKMTGSRLVTLRDVRIHLTFRPGLSACVSDAINGYFADGTLPETDIVCAADQPPQ
ncbi:alpha/beta hydrolase [Nocardia donostiensis]|nr:alpha/beta hydrolase [Nocardia donostiensis]